MEFLKLKPLKEGIENIIVVTDHFTKYSQAHPTQNQTTKTTPKVLFEIYFIQFPKRLHSDQGRNFESRTIAELCKIAGIQKRTTPYHVMGNGLAERFNSTLMSMLETLEPSQKWNWKSHIGSCVHAYNCTKHKTTGFSPFYLMFGHHPRIPVNLVSGKVEEQDTITKNNQISHTKVYNRKVRRAVLEIGDRVLLQNVGLKGTTS